MNISKWVNFNLKIFFISFAFLCAVQAVFSYYYLGAVSIPLLYLVAIIIISYTVAKSKKGK